MRWTDLPKRCAGCGEGIPAPREPIRGLVYICPYCSTEYDPISGSDHCTLCHALLGITVVVLVAVVCRVVL